MQDKLIAYLVQQVLKYIDTAIVSKALVGILRGACGALKDVAARTSSPVDDQVVAALTATIEGIAAALKVP